MTSTPNTRLDALLRIAEDVAVVAGTAVTTWNATHNANDVVTAVTAAPLVRSGIAQALTKGRVSGVVLALRLVWQALDNVAVVLPVVPPVAPASEGTPAA